MDHDHDDERPRISEDLVLAELEDQLEEGIGIDLTKPVNPHKNECTVCTGDTRDNVWFQPKAPGYPGRCILDEITYDDVYEVLLKFPTAAADLARITDVRDLQTLARTVKVEMDPLDDDRIFAKRLNANTLPMYNIMYGNFDGTVMGRKR
jgi:hypothetical protein